MIDELDRVDPVVRPMFGCHAIYVRDKIVLILRHRKDFPSDNGVWMATAREHHHSLKLDFPSMRSISLFGKRETEWQNIPLDADDFEELVTKACKLVVKGDLRIGKIPNKKKK